MEIQGFLENLKQIGTSPYAFAAYIGLLGAWVYSAIARHRLDKVAQILKDIPPKDRAEIIAREYHTNPRTGLSAEQWIRSRRQAWFFGSFLAFIVCATIVAIIALVSMSPKQLRELKELGGKTASMQVEAANAKEDLKTFTAAKEQDLLLNLVKTILVGQNQDAVFKERANEILGNQSLNVNNKVSQIALLAIAEIDNDTQRQAQLVNSLNPSSPSIDVETMKLKRLIDKRGQMFDLLRRIVDEYNQTAKGIIDSIGR